MFGRIGQGFGRLGGSRHMSSEVKKVTLIPGDGIGPEIAKCVQRFVQPKGSAPKCILLSPRIVLSINGK